MLLLLCVIDWTALVANENLKRKKHSNELTTPCRFCLFRHMSDVASISHAGYLLKRSNRPHSVLWTPPPSHYQTAAAQDDYYGHQDHERDTADALDYLPAAAADNDEDLVTSCSGLALQPRPQLPQHLQLVHNSTTILRFPSQTTNECYRGEEKEETNGSSSSLSWKQKTTSMFQHQLQEEKHQPENDEDDAQSRRNRKGHANLGADSQGTDENGGLAQSSVEFASIFFGIDLQTLHTDSALLHPLSPKHCSNHTSNPDPAKEMSPVSPQSPEIGNLSMRSTAPIPMAQVASNNDNPNVANLEHPIDDSLQKRHVIRRSSNPISIRAHSCRVNTKGTNPEHNLPPDVYDTADGHVWRAKYCVLEHGVLYFYRHEADAEESSARMERQKHAELIQQQQEICRVAAATVTGATTTTSNVFVNNFPRNLAHSPIPTILWKNDEEDSGHCWEKCVALSSVGAVRSAELEYGENAFELSSSDDEDMDKLILRARDSDDMNEWLFQFHRAIASFVLDIMECAAQNSMTANSSTIMGDDVIQRSLLRAHNRCDSNFVTTSPDRSTAMAYHLAAFSPLHQRPLCSVPSGTKSLSHGHGRNSLHRRRVDLLSPGGRFNNHSVHHAGRMAMSLQDSPPFPLLPTGTSSTRDSPSLSFRHGQSLIPQSSGTWRSKPQHHVNNNGIDIISATSSHLVTPNLRQQHYHQQDQQSSLESSTCPPELACASNHEAATDNPETERPPPTQSNREQHSSFMITGGSASSSKYVPPHLRNRDFTATVSVVSNSMSTPSPEPSCVESRSFSSGTDSTINSSANTTPATSCNGKYVPPSLRNRSNAPMPASSATHVQKPTMKYVPPHLRNVGYHQPVEKYVPPNLGNGTSTATLAETIDNFSVGNETLTIPSIPSTPLARGEQQHAIDSIGAVFMPFGEADMIVEHLDVKLGGCADPALMNGSILDEVFIPRKASRLGNVRGAAFGSVSSSNGTGSTLRWEIGAVSECGVRESNEDSYFVSSDLSRMFSDSRKSPTVWDNADTKHSSGLFAVFDGHCGNHASRFAAERLAVFIEEHSIRRAHEVGIRGDTSLVEEILRHAIMDLDREFCQLCVADGREWESGTTALIAALVNEHLVIANLGDARGVMSRSVASEEEVYQLEEAGWTELPATDYSGDRRCLWKEVTETHHPAREDERARIERANGWITTEKEIPVGQLKRMMLCDQDVVAILKRCFADRYQPSPKASAPQRILQISRVCGELAVSRAIGDRDFKAAFNNPTRPDASDDTDEPEWGSSLFLPYPDDHNRCFVGDLVSNKPDFQILRVGEEGVTEEFLLLACDGLWDVMDADDAVRVTRDLLFEKGWSAKLAANRLAELAVHLGSSDNVTVIVVRFFSRDANCR